MRTDRVYYLPSNLGGRHTLIRKMPDGAIINVQSNTKYGFTQGSPLSPTLSIMILDALVMQRFGKPYISNRNWEIEDPKLLDERLSDLWKNENVTRPLNWKAEEDLVMFADDGIFSLKNKIGEILDLEEEEKPRVVEYLISDHTNGIRLNMHKSK